MTRRTVTKKRQPAKAGQRKAAAGRRGRQRGWLIAGVGGAVVLAAIVAIVATGGGEGDDPLPAAAVTVTGDALPPLAAGADPAIGTAAPGLSGTDFADAPVTIANDGRPKMIVFLAHWCPHCQAEVPVVQEWLDREGMPTDVDLYSVATAIDENQPNYPPDAWLQEEGWTVPTLVDDEAGSAATAYGLSAFPFWTFVDAEGNVVGRTTGELSIAEIEAYIEAIA
jgi:thiol-disulfide isomerase/thioredoxin